MIHSRLTCGKVKYHLIAIQSLHSLCYVDGHFWLKKWNNI